MPRPTEPIELALRKLGHRRGVYRARLGELAAVVKLSFHRLGWIKLARERRRLEALGRRGLPAPGVLGEGAAAPGRYALVLEEAAGGVGFEAAWEGAPSAAARRALLGALAASLSAFHRSGVEHRDPHPRNLLAGPSGLCWVDAGALRIRRRGSPLPHRRAVRNLAAVHAAFAEPLGASARDWLHALGVYLGPGAGREARRRWVREIHRAGLRLSNRYLRRRSLRCLRTNRDFLRVRRPGRLGFVRRDALGPAWERFLQCPVSLLEGAQVLKRSRSTLAARVDWDGRPAFLKRYCRPGLLHRLKCLFRRSPAARSWVMGHAFELAALPAPRPLAAVEERRLGWPVVSTLVTEWVEGVRSDALLAKGGLGGDEGRALAGELAALLARAHALGIRHRDLKPQNVFSSGPGGAVSLVDLDGVRLQRRLRRRTRLRDLERWGRDLEPSSPLGRVLEEAYRARFTREVEGSAGIGG